MYSLGPGGLELFATHERDIIQVLRLLPYGTRRARDATIQHLEDLKLLLVHNRTIGELPDPSRGSDNSTGTGSESHSGMYGTVGLGSETVLKNQYYSGGSTRFCLRFAGGVPAGA